MYLQLKGLGYNNGVTILNEICKQCYSNNDISAVGRSIRMEDILDDYVEYKTENAYQPIPYDFKDVTVPIIWLEHQQGSLVKSQKNQSVSYPLTESLTTNYSGVIYHQVFPAELRPPGAVNGNWNPECRYPLFRNVLNSTYKRDNVNLWIATRWNVGPGPSSTPTFGIFSATQSYNIIITGTHGRIAPMVEIPLSKVDLVPCATDVADYDLKKK